MKTIGTIYGDAVCRSCGQPSTMHSTFDRLCPRCYRDTTRRQAITRAYVARTRPKVSPTCPYDAIAQYEAEALEDYGRTA